MPDPKKLVRQQWLPAASSLRAHSPIRKALPSSLAQPKSVGRSHETRPENQAFAFLQNSTSDTHMVLHEDALSMTPFKEVAEALNRLDTRVAMQQNCFEAALVDSYGEVASACTHVVRQCDSLAAHMSRLEVLMTQGDVTRAKSAGSTFGKDQGTQTECNSQKNEEVRDCGRGPRARVCSPLMSDDSRRSRCEVVKIKSDDSKRSRREAVRPARVRLDDDSPNRQESGAEIPPSPSKAVRPSQGTVVTIGSPSPKAFRPSQSTFVTIGTCGTPGDGLFLGNRYGDVVVRGEKKKSLKSMRSVAEWMSPSAWVFGSYPLSRTRTFTALGASSKNSECKDRMNPECSSGPATSSKSVRMSQMSMKMELEEEGGAAHLMFGTEAAEGVNSHEVMFSDVDTSRTTPRYYRHTHWATDLVVHDRFLKFCLWVVFVNAAYIGIEANWNAQSKSLYRSPWFFIIMSNVFCTFYVFEWILHFVAFSHPKHAVTQVSHLVDTVLALVTALDTWVLEPLLFFDMLEVSGYFVPHHVVRLVFLARFARFVKAVPELLTLTRGIVLATRALFWTFTMLAFVTYVFGIVMHTLMADENALNEEMGSRNFATLDNAMWTLVIDGALIEEFGVRMTLMLHQYRVKTSLACISMALYLFIAALTILNMLIGVMNEVVNSITALEKTESAVALMKRTILKQLLKFDDGNGLISKYELELVMCDPESESVLQSLNVDRLFLLELQQMLFPNEEAQVTISTVVELMLLCRGDNVTTVRTLASGLLYISSLIYKLEAYLNPDAEFARTSNHSSNSSHRESQRQKLYKSEDDMCSPARVQAAAYRSEGSIF